MMVADAPVPPRDVEALPLILQLVAATYQTPGPALLRDLDRGAIADAIARVADGLDLETPTLPDTDPTTLRSSHVDLFVSSAHAPTSPPYVGYALDGELLGPSAEAMGRFLASHGIGTDPAWRDLPDHLAAVAEAASILSVTGQHHAAERVAREWLLPWFDRYATEVASKDVSDFYGPLTTFLHAAIREVTRGDRS
jgi:TorA maturation chaperone TorD